MSKNLCSVAVLKGRVCILRLLRVSCFRSGFFDVDVSKNLVLLSGQDTPANTNAVLGVLPHDPFHLLAVQFLSVLL